MFAQIAHGYFHRILQQKTSEESRTAYLEQLSLCRGINFDGQVGNVHVADVAEIVVKFRGVEQRESDDNIDARLKSDQVWSIVLGSKNHEPVRVNSRTRLDQR